MGYAEVSVNSPVAQRRSFSYSIPPGLAVEVGQAVWVPFGDKLLQGIVLELTPHPAVAETREIAGVIEERPLLSPAQVALALWLSEYYLCPLFDAVALMLPPGFERRLVSFIFPTQPPEDFDPSTLTPEQSRVLDLARQKTKLSLRQVEKLVGKKRAPLVISQLVRHGLVSRSYELEPSRARPKIEPFISLAISAEQAQDEISRLRQKRISKQAALIEFLTEQKEPIPWAAVRKRIGCDKAVANALVRKGLVTFQPVEVRREPISYAHITPSPSPTLTPPQRAALESISSALTSGKPKTFLLYGVTGSGKTEVYLQALARATALGKRGIVLVPEIALTPQTIERFASRFPRRVAVLHSKLSLGEQFDEWRRIRDGGVDVVIGPRSAIFAPQPDLGLIVIDEEQEWSYKQQDKSPRYHARNVALKLAELTGAVVILGSATPDVETFYRAQQGDYHLLQLPERVTPAKGSALPKVEVVDMREELKAGNLSPFSRTLSGAIKQALKNREQVILFLNRRGGASFIQCRGCGFVLRCRRCDFPLTYHPAEAALVCHQCNERRQVPQFCPRCLSRRIKFLGIGTQKVEQEVEQAFPQARLLRWDSDVTRGRYSHEEILGKFRRQEADILIGTQMIAKGLDLPMVTLVGVVNADVALNLPDFRAGERTFQLLSQVAGRAGRGSLGGRVIVQTYSPDSYVIQAAAKHDYASFYEQEINYRRQLRHPPFTQLARLLFSHTNDGRCQREAELMKLKLSQEIESQGIANIELIGPAPAFIHRLRGRFRWQLILRGWGLSEFLSRITLPQGWTIEIDPIGLV